MAIDLSLYLYLVIAACMLPNCECIRNGTGSAINEDIDVLIGETRAKHDYLALPYFAGKFSIASSVNTIVLEDWKFGRLSGLRRVGDAILSAKGNKHELTVKLRVREFFVSVKKFEILLFSFKTTGNVDVSCRGLSTTLTVSIVKKKEACQVTIDKGVFDGQHLTECRLRPEAQRASWKKIDVEVRKFLKANSKIIVDLVNPVLPEILNLACEEQKKMLCDVVE